jgi:fluoroquinolone transport system permease protein
MKPLIRSFKMFISQIWHDNMLIAVCIAPLLAALFFRFGIPAIERILCGYFNKTTILADYYLLFDLFLSILTPYMVCFASSMVMLTEYDENMAQYTAVTPVGKKGYFISRLVFPASISFFASVLLMLCFSLTAWSLPLLIIVCFLSSLTSVAVSLLLFSFSHNRVEGMAVAKMAGLIMLGLPVPFFLLSKAQYLFSILPSFWIAKLCLEQSYWLLMPALIMSAIWIWLLYGKFKKKLS